MFDNDNDNDHDNDNDNDNQNTPLKNDEKNSQPKN